MIYAIGTDIVQISRIADTLARTGERFVEKVLGTEEIQEYQRRSLKVAARGLHYLCNRYAAKEAFSKALGLGMREPMSWHAIQILNDEHGAPHIVTSGALDEYMKKNKLTAMATMSDEVDYSVAFVVIER